MSFTVAFLGVGSLGTKVAPDLSFTPVLYLVPFIAIAFDIHIGSEDFRIKRIGEFIMLGKSGASDEEKEWEKYVRMTPSPLPPIQNMIVTGIIIAGAALALWHKEPDSRFFACWLTVSVLLEAATAWRIYLLRKRLISGDRMKQTDHGQTLIELLVMLAFFSIGFVVGHLVANDTGNLGIGILSGFLAAYVSALAVGGIGRLIFPEKMAKKPTRNVDGGSKSERTAEPSA